jgi:hypothetical protein
MSRFEKDQSNKQHQSSANKGDVPLTTDAVDPTTDPATFNQAVAFADGSVQPSAAATTQQHRAAELSPGSSKNQHMTPHVDIQGGKVSISHFHLLNVGVDVGSEENSVWASYAPGTLRTLILTCKDHAARKRLASLLSGVMAELNK